MSLKYISKRSGLRVESWEVPLYEEYGPILLSSITKCSDLFEIKLRIKNLTRAEIPMILRSCMRILGMTLLKASLMSRKAHIVEELLIKPLYIPHARITKLSMQDLSGLNPSWLSGITCCDSMCHCMRLYIIFFHYF